MKRICSLETEYGIVFPTKKRILSEKITSLLAGAMRFFQRPFSSNYALLEPIRDDSAMNILTFETAREKERAYWRNGVQAYIDNTRHLELALPECSNPYDVAVYDAAATQVLNEIAIRHDGLVIKSSIDSLGDIRGCHENYFLDDSRFREKARGHQYVNKCMSPFLVSRILYAGAGSLTDTLEMSQRARATQGTLPSDALHFKSIYVPKDSENFSSSGIRLHIVLGDANMSDYATFLKVGTAWIVTTMIEHDFVPSSIENENWINLLHGISEEADVVMQQGSAINSAIGLNIQREYLSLAHDFFAKHSDLNDNVTRCVLREWEFTLDCLARNPEALIGKVDWITKYLLLNAFAKSEKKQLTDKSVRLAASEYHLVGANGLYDEAVRAGFCSSFVRGEDIKIAMQTPPSDTRAALRTRIMEEMKNKGALLIANWHLLKYNVPNTDRWGFQTIEYDLHDPLMTKCDPRITDFTSD